MLKLDLEVSKGRRERLVLREGEDVDEAALAFVRAHGLGVRAGDSPAETSKLQGLMAKRVA